MGSRHQLHETLNRISSILGATPEQHHIFEGWALGQLRALVKAEKESEASLRWLALEYRHQYLELQQDLTNGIVVTGRTDLLRTARKEWLSSLLDWVDQLQEERAA